MIKKHDLRFKITDSPQNRADEVCGSVAVSQTLLIAKFKTGSVCIDHEQEAKERIASGINRVVYGDVVSELDSIRRDVGRILDGHGTVSSPQIVIGALHDRISSLINKLEWRDQ